MTHAHASIVVGNSNKIIYVRAGCWVTDKLRHFQIPKSKSHKEEVNQSETAVHGIIQPSGNLTLEKMYFCDSTDSAVCFKCEQLC